MGQGRDYEGKVLSLFNLCACMVFDINLLKTKKIVFSLLYSKSQK